MHKPVWAFPFTLKCLKRIPFSQPRDSSFCKIVTIWNWHSNVWLLGGHEVGRVIVHENESDSAREIVIVVREDCRRSRKNILLVSVVYLLRRLPPFKEEHLISEWFLFIGQAECIAWSWHFELVAGDSLSMCWLESPLYSCNDHGLQLFNAFD